MKKSLLLILSLLMCITVTSQLHVSTRKIKSYISTEQYTTPINTHYHTSAANDEVTAKAYGIRCYDATQGSTQQFVSFDVNNPNKIDLEKDLSQYYIRAAAHANGFYYMINSRDGMCPYDLLAMDMETLQVDTIASYDVNDYESAIIFLDMTYDETTSTMYGIGYDLETAIVDDNNEEELEVKLALVTIDLIDGSMTCIGHQDSCNLLTLAADNKGYLWGLDSNGELWNINKSTGHPGEGWGYATDVPSLLQSMCFHPENNILYWCGFSSDEFSAEGFFSQFTFGEDAVTYNKIGTLSNNAEIVGLYIDANPISPLTPTAVSNVNIRPADEGECLAYITWDNPTTLVNGENITGTFDITVYRNNTAITHLTDQSSGRNNSYTDIVPTSGLHNYKIVCSNENGDGKAYVVKNVYIGRDLPGSVSNLQITKITGKNEVTISWDAPTTGVNGGWYDRTTLTYTITRYPDEKILVNETTATTYTDTDLATLGGYSYSITSQNSDGIGATITSDRITVGEALETPYTCTFDTDESIKMWSVIDGDNDGHEWFPSSYSSTGQTFMKFAPDTKYNPATPADDWLISPPIKLSAGTTYALEYDMLLLGPIFPLDYDVTIGKDATIAAQSTIIESTDSLVINMSFTPQKVVFTVDEDGEYYIGYHIRNAVMVQITNVAIDKLDNIDIALSDIKFSSIGNVNSPMQFIVTIHNLGSDAIQGEVVTLLDKNDNILCHTTGEAVVESQHSTQHILEWTPQEIGETELRVRIEYEGDMIPENNISDELNILVLEEGEWSNIQHNNALMNYTPFILSYKNSWTETIYYADEIKQSNAALNDGNWLIKGLIYYTYIFNNGEVNDFNATIALANTDLTEPDESDNSIAYTQVFNGTISPTSTSTSIYIPFDTPFAYDGRNLLVKSQHSSQYENYNTIFYGSRDDSGYWRSWHYASDDKTFDTTLIELSNEVPNVSFFMTESNGVKELENYTSPQVYLSHGHLIVNGEYDTLYIYSMDGRLCATYTSSQPCIALNNWASGLYIVDVIHNNRHSISKIAINQ